MTQPVPATADDGGVGFGGLSSVRVAELALLATCFVWGAGFVVGKWTLAHFSPLVFVGIRYAIGALCMLPFYWRELQWEHAFAACVVGTCLFCAFALQTAGLALTTPSRNGACALLALAGGCIAGPHPCAHLAAVCVSLSPRLPQRS